MYVQAFVLFASQLHIEFLSFFFTAEDLSFSVIFDSPDYKNRFFSWLLLLLFLLLNSSNRGSSELSLYKGLNRSFEGCFLLFFVLGLVVFLENMVVNCSNLLNDLIVVGQLEESSYLLHPGVSDVQLVVVFAVYQKRSVLLFKLVSLIS
jgi:hypothetical protein